MARRHDTSIPADLMVQAMSAVDETEIPIPKVIGDNAIALAEWKRITAELCGKGILTHFDRAMLVSYCLLWANMVLVASMNQGESGLPISTHDMKVFTELRQVAAELRFTPRSRDVKTTGLDEKTRKVGKMASFLNASPEERAKIAKEAGGK